MKARSTKLRTLITLHTLFKRTDKDHCINSVGLNEYLKPYNLDCDKKALRDTSKILREYGMDIQFKPGGKTCGVWLNNHPLEPTKLDRLIFAVTTNPHISKEEASEILSYLKPLVTVYQEEDLIPIIDTSPDFVIEESLYTVYSTICKAIKAKRRVRFHTKYMGYCKEIKTIAQKISKGILFTPKWIYQTKGELYVVGYNNTRERIQAINLQSITDIMMSQKLKPEIIERSLNMLEGIAPRDYIPTEKEVEIYRGEVVFYCKDRLVEEIYNRFGSPCKPISVNIRHWAKYTVADAVITTKTLFWLSGLEEHTIRIKEPKKLKDSIRNYYFTISETITKPK